MRALRSFTVHPRLPERLAPLQALAMNLRWSWDERTQDLFRWVDPDAWEVGRSRPDPAPGQRRPLPARVPGRRPGLPVVHGRGPRRPAPRRRGRPLVPGPREPAALGGLLLTRVRHLRGAAPVLRRPRRAGRRPPQGGQRPRRAARRRRPLLPPGVFPPGAGGRRLAAGALRRPRSPRDGPRPRREPAGAGRPGRHHAGRPHLGGPRRPGAAVPARRRRRRQRRRLPHGHRPPLRRRQRAPAAPGDPPRCGRRAGAGAARARTAGVPLQRGPRRLPRPRAGAPGHPRRRAHLRRGHRGGPGRHGVHHPHPGARRHGPLPPLPHGEVLQGLGRRVQRALRPGHEPRPPARRAGRRPVQHGRHGPAPGRHRQRRLEAARRGQPPDLRPGVAGGAGRGASHHLGHQRGALPHVGGAGDARPVRPPRPARVEPGRPRPLGPHRGRRRRRAVAGPPAGP